MRAFRWSLVAAAQLSIPVIVTPLRNQQMPEPIDRLTVALAARYRIERELGAGGMATVFLAEDLKHHRQVALKVLRPELSAAIGAERFLHEIQIMAGLRHPHILPLFDSGEADGMLFYVMPYVTGETLQDRLNRDQRLPVADALAIAGDVAAALTFAHTRGVIHRDIKPANILLEDGEGLVADFGIALALARADDTRLTGTGISLGTPTYMSPEQIMGERTLDGRSDVYALGCVLFEMLTGEPPFHGRNIQSVISQGLAAPPPSARSRRDDIPPAIDAAIKRALAKDPDDRFATPRALVDACAVVERTQPGWLGRRWLLTATLAAAALVAVVAFPLWRSAQTARARALLPTIQDLAQKGDFPKAFDLAVSAERRIAGDSALNSLFALVSDSLTITTEPSGARVYLRRVPVDEPTQSGESTDSVLLGTTPITGRRVARGDYWMAIRKDGVAPMERIASSAFGRAEAGIGGRTVHLAFTMLPADSVPPDMVAVPGGLYTIANPDLPQGLSATLPPFFIDRFEVFNDEYQAFVRSASYGSSSWWVTATAAGLGPGRFVDRTTLSAPRNWVNQSPPSGTGRHPVNNVSWYEAAAYCSAVGKRLPTLFEFEKAARGERVSQFGVMMPWGYQSAVARTERRANFGGTGTLPVDSLPFGISPYGAYAMAGNVKEWLANPVEDGFAVAGGSWQDPAYLFSEVGVVKPTESSAAIGFRCVRTGGAKDVPLQQAAARLQIHPPTRVYRPVDDATYRTLLRYYRYDRRPANARGIISVETADWRRERLWIDGVGGDSVLAYLYLPKRATAPYQTLVYVPSSATFFFETVRESAEYDLGPLIRGGRAVLAVVMHGMLERPFPAEYVLPSSETVGFRDLMVRHATELRLGMDYLETRTDIDTTRMAYVGMSFGAGSRLPFAAVDNRFRSVVLIGAGIDERVQPTLPEAANFNFAPHIRVPKLVLNGTNDEEHPWKSRGKPLWDLLREPKELVMIEGAGHHPPVVDRVPPIKAFLDRTLGPVGPAKP